MKLIKLIVVLLFAVMILVLGLLVASVSGCAPIASNTAPVVQQPPTATAIPDADGTLSRPLNVDAPPGASAEIWTVTSETGTHPWTISTVYVEYPMFKVDTYILHDLVVYHIMELNSRQRTMTVQQIDR
jgi:hypothetical protein